MKTLFLTVLLCLSAGSRLFAGSEAMQLAEAKLRSANQLFSKGEYQETVALLGGIYEQPINKKIKYRVYILLGDAYFELKRYDSAIDSYSMAAAIYTDRCEPKLRLAKTYESNDLLDLAKFWYEKILDVNPISYEANFGVARLHTKIGLNDKAMEYYKKALSLKDTKEANKAIALCAYSLGELPFALDRIQRVLSMGKDYESLLFAGRIVKKMDNYSQAEILLTEASLLDPIRPDAYLQLAVLFIESGQLEKAEAGLKAVIKLYPDNSLAHFFLSYIYYNRSSDVRALNKLSKLATLNLSPNLRKYSQKLEKLLKN